MSTRGKQLVTLALNQELKRKLAVVKSKAKIKRSTTSNTTTVDPEYIPPKNSDSSSCTDSSEEENNVTVEDALGVNRFVKSIVSDLINKVFETHERSQKQIYTKKGLIRKRRLYDLPVTERKRQRLEKVIEDHQVKSPCTEKCRLKCPQVINLNRQKTINKQFWQLEKTAQKAFIMSCIKKQCKKRNTTRKEDSRRKYSFQYVLKKDDGLETYVCKTFLLATLGFTANNDRLIKSVRDVDGAAMITPPQDKRGHHPNSRKIDRNIIVEHIKSFRPQISHYRREHAPKRLYLPSDISVTLMYNHFKEKYTNIKVSYELYRKEVAEMNISFTKLGHEECFDCTKFDLHSKTTGHNIDIDLNLNCEECVSCKNHKDKYQAARAEYQKDGTLKISEKLVVSADLQKVIMLPRAEMFKEVIFIPRVIAFNESFVAIGKSEEKAKQSEKRPKPTAVIWHEGVAGRKKEDLVSTFYAFLLNNRDCRNIIIWLDNCSSQNKNWTLFSFFIYAVNCAELELENLELKYFEPGHTFMSADSFHHQVELSLKRKGKVFDFNDYKCAVQEANSSKVNIIEMRLQNFFDWKDLSSKYKLQKASPRPYLHDMVHLLFKRGKKICYFKNKFSNKADDFIELNFLTAKHFKEKMPDPIPKRECKGVTLERKENLLSKLRPIMPPNRIQFWEELALTNNTDDVDDEDEV